MAMTSLSSSDGTSDTSDTSSSELNINLLFRLGGFSLSELKCKDEMGGMVGFFHSLN